MYDEKNQKKTTDSFQINFQVGFQRQTGDQGTWIK